MSNKLSKELAKRFVKLANESAKKNGIQLAPKLRK